ncbi:CBS domain-containing protein [Streptomyces sp. HB132]|uniref:CBS domain-containing protein n=1 Tax=Streptomyces sp. HB132 TaxID=767388 RepID=UPI001960404A|nr:CBS domain-containing protein [Streptomyces sp. HB132]MBM7440252.1 CBS domain-containing protein [Streptomyces sp. HB132]
MTVSPHTVSDLMTHTAVAVGSRASYKDIVELMDEWKVSALPVLVGEGRVIGVVSEADLLPKEENRPAATSAPGDPPPMDVGKADALYAEQLMSSPAVTVHADATIAEAARIMARRHVKRLPVVDGSGLLQGVVSRGDLLKVFLRSDEDIASEALGVLGGIEAAAGMGVQVSDGVVVLGGTLSDRSLVPLIARAVRAVEGVVDIRLDLRDRDGHDRAQGAWHAAGSAE